MKRTLSKRVISLLLVFVLVFAAVGFFEVEDVSAAVTLKSSTIKDYVLAKVGQNYPNGYCLKFVEECYQNLGATRPYSCCASKSGNLFIISHSNSNIPIGATVYFGNCGGGPCRSCGSSYYGHVGIYVGDGYFVHATGGKVQKSTISSWANKYRGYGYCGNFNLNQDLNSILPGTVDSNWNVPTNITATHKITTYDQWGNAESNHYIDPGDNCYISEVYTNGFVKVQYPVSGGKRWAYAKASDFSLNKKQSLPSTKLRAWFSTSAMGGQTNNIRVNDLVYLCYRLETQDGKLLDPSIGNYTVKETMYLPDGSAPSYSYQKSNNNWIRSNFGQWGTYRGVVEISGDYTGRVEVSYTISQPKQILLDSWFSASKMGNKVSYMEKGKTYYLCYSIKCDNKKYLNEIGNWNYNVTEEIYAPDGKKVYGYTYDKSDNNWVSFTASQSGTYKGIITIKGQPNGSETITCACKDMSTPKLQSIQITSYPKKMTYTVGDKLDTSGMVVTASYSNNSKKKITNYKVSGDTAKAGTATVTVSYTESGVTKTSKFTITVKEKVQKTVTITYNSCGGSWAQKQQKVKENEKINLLSGQPGKTYKVTFDSNGGTLSQKSVSLSAAFRGWYTQLGGSGTCYMPEQRVSFNKDVTLYASYGTAKIGTLPIPNRDGYTFSGWYMANGGKVSSDTVISVNCTLTAKWQKKEHIHTPGEWIVVQEATTKKPGKKVIKCEECGQILETEVIPAITVEDDAVNDNTEDDDEEPLGVGDEITTDKAVYTITKLGANPCVEYTQLFDDDVSNAVIPSSITENGVTYKVTSVGSKAFYKNTGIRTVTIGKNITKIGGKVFYGCTSLKKIVIKSEKLSSGSIGAKAFTKVNKKIKVYVPSMKYKSYKKILKKAGIGSKAKIYKLS